MHWQISALDIENKILEHPNVEECAVLGIPDDVMGEVVGVVIASKQNLRIDIDSLSSWCRDKMPPYHIPKVLETMDKIPRNAMGKINKKDLLKVILERSKINKH